MIEFSGVAYDAVIEHAVEGRKGTPREVCGLLGGDPGEDASRVEAVRRARNASETPRYEYYIDPEEQFELIEEMEAEGLEVAGFYHSHPEGPPNPSETDAERATWPGLSYVIVALDGAYPFVGSWRWNGEAERFEQEAVRKVA